MRHGPTLTLVMSDPGRGTAALREVTVLAAKSTKLPVSTENGAEDGLVQVHVWAGSLGLGLPTDPPEAWADLGLALGTVVRQVRPQLALSAPEWSVTSLADPDPEELRPGLTCGWARLDGLDDQRAARLAVLEQRGVVHAVWEGYAWAAEGAAALDGVTAGTVERVAGAVQRAWYGDVFEGSR